MIYYIHGYKSNCQGEKVSIAKNILNIECIEYTTKEIENNTVWDKLDKIQKEDSVIGSSMGGYLALVSKAKQKFLLNPLMDAKLLLLLGPYENFVNTSKNPEYQPKIKDMDIYTFLGKYDSVLAHDINMFYKISKELHIFNDGHNFKLEKYRVINIIRDILDSYETSN